MDDSPQKIRMECVRLLYRFTLRITPFNLFIGTIISVILYFQNMPWEILSVWYVFLVAFTVFRYLHARRVLKSAKSTFYGWRLESIFFVLIFITGLTWGALYLLAIPYISPEIRVILILVLGGMSAAGMVSLTSVFTAYLLFIFPMLLPVLVHYLLMWDFNHLMVDLMFAFFGLSLILGGILSHRIIIKNVELRFKKDNLIRDLVQTNYKLDMSYDKIQTIAKEKDELIEKMTLTNQQLQAANEKIKTISRTDELTRIYNRRYFDEILAIEWLRAHRNQKTLALVLLDIDEFKAYNDHYGHVQGDYCLAKVAQVLSECIQRPGDLCARYGGEEFGIILPDTDIVGANTIAHEVHAKIAAAEIEHVGSKISTSVTVSCGVAALVPQSAVDPAENLINTADRPLYQAKHEGRNRVVADTIA